MYKCTNSVQPRKQGAIMKKVLTVFIAVILVAPSFVRQLRNNTAQSDGTTVKLGAQILAALRLVFRLRSCIFRL